jgi:hypothetical protein
VTVDRGNRCDLRPKDGLNKQNFTRGDSTMFRKFTIVALPVLIIALAAFSANDSAFARGHGGGHGGGHRGGHRSSGHRSGGHRVSHSRGNRSRSHNRNRSRNHRHDHRHRHHRGYGWGYGFGGDSDGGDDGGDGDYGMDGVYAGVDAYVPESITILNPPETRRTVGYALDSAQYSLDSAQTQVYDGGPRLITFDRGGSYGQAQYTLQPGTYRFVATDRGLDLRTVTDQVASN